MGKVHCEACKKSCKGKAVRLQDKYFHIKCFNCKHCKKPLAAGGFYAKDSEYYCTEDYQKLFGTKCAACNKFVEGEVITALGNTYHQNCFSCTKCGKKFGAGDKVTFSNKDYLCNQCLNESDADMKKFIDNKLKKSPKKKGAPGKENGERPASATSPTGKPLTASHVKSGGPITSTPAKAEINHLSSPTSDASDFSSDRRLDAEFSDDESFLRPPTPGQRGRLSPIQQILQYRTPSPVGSAVSRSSRKSADSSGRQSRMDEPDYSRFLKTSYLEQPVSYKRGPSINPIAKSTSPHYHRPESRGPQEFGANHFSYRNTPRDFMRPVRKDGMLSTLAGSEEYQTKRTMDNLVPMNKEEAIRMSKFPDAHKPDIPRPLPIERDDWPAPPAPAAAYPELLRHGLGRGRSEPTLDNDQPDGPPDPRVQQNIEELKKIRDSVPKPGYGLGSGSKSATLPTDSRNGSYFEDFEKERVENGSTDELSRRSYHTSQSSVEEYDPETGLRKSRWRAASATRSMSGMASGRMSAPPYMSYRRSIPSLFKPDEPPRIYAYEQLLVTNENLPPDVDRNNAEYHLSQGDFEGIFRMSREDFYRLAEWKRNDLKRRVCLF